eukprot:scaffold8321_cov138-Isochrysis_galbana.AAC.2
MALGVATHQRRCGGCPSKSCSGLRTPRASSWQHLAGLGRLFDNHCAQPKKKQRASEPMAAERRSLAHGAAACPRCGSCLLASQQRSAIGRSLSLPSAPPLPPPPPPHPRETPPDADSDAGQHYGQRTGLPALASRPRRAADMHRRLAQRLRLLGLLQAIHDVRGAEVSVL